MASKKVERKPTRSGITVSFEPSEKKLIRKAAVETDTRSSSEFIRRAAVKAAQQATGKAA